MDQHQSMRSAGSTAWASSILVSVIRVYYVSLGFVLSVLSLIYRCRPPVSAPVAAPTVDSSAATSVRPLAGSANPKLRPRRPTAQAFPALAPAPPKGILLPPRPHSTPPLDGKGSLSHSTSQESVRVYFVDSHLQNGTGRRLSASAAGRSDGGLVKPKAKMGSLCLSTNPSASTPSLPLVEPPLDQNESQTQAPLTTESPNATLTTSTKLRKCMMRSKSFDDLAQRSSNSALPPVKVERHSSDSVTSVSTKERRGSVETPVVKEELSTRFELGSFWGIKKKRSGTLRTQPYAAPYFCEPPSSPGSSRPSSPSPSSSSSSNSSSTSSVSSSEVPLTPPALDQESSKSQKNKLKLKRPSSSRSLNPRIIVTPS